MNDREALADAIRELEETARRYAILRQEPMISTASLRWIIETLQGYAALLEPQPSTPKCYYPKCWRNATTNRRGYPICDEHREVQLAIEAYEGREPTAQERARTEQAIANAEKRPEPQPSLSVQEAAKLIHDEMYSGAFGELTIAHDMAVVIPSPERLASIISRVAEPQGAPEAWRARARIELLLLNAREALGEAAPESLSRVREACLWLDDAIRLYRAAAPPEGTGELREALRQAADWFEEYAEIHDRKGDEQKKRRNQSRSDYCRAALRTPAAHEEAPEPSMRPGPASITPYDARKAVKAVAAPVPPLVERLHELMNEMNAGINGEGDPSRPNGQDATTVYEASVALQEAAASLAASVERERRIAVEAFKAGCARGGMDCSLVDYAANDYARRALTPEQA